MPLKQFLALFLRRRGKVAFLVKLHPNAKILDVGCGNNSPFKVKQILPGCHYTGIDIGDHNQSKPNLADQYIITTGAKFTNEISNLASTFDAVISSHNLEHCDDRMGTFRAMLGSLKPGGEIYLSFPSEQSIGFPRRAGTLNYYDDETHKSQPPDYNEIVDHLKTNGFEIKFATPNYQPCFLFFLGMILEPLSHLKRKIMPGTWEYYGFESIVWARKRIAGTASASA